MKEWRNNLVLLFIFLFAAAVLSRLFFIQVINHNFYAALAKGQQTLVRNWQGDRGEIFFQNHEYPVATTKIYTSVFISPKEIPAEKQTETAQILSEILNINEASLLGKVVKDSLYELIKEKLDQQEVGNLKEKGLAGVHFKEEKLRYYPYGDFASNLLGFVNKDGYGQYGIEEYWDDILRGKEEFLEGERGPLGYLFFSGEELSASRGLDIVLTVDYNIQYLAEKLLKDAQKNLKAEGGQIIVIEPVSGKILALASFPSFNPNEYAKERDLKIFQNNAIQAIFEPGSVFKAITMAGALDKNKITFQTTYFDPGCFEIGRSKVCNYEERIYPGTLTMTNVLEKSINTGAVFAERELGDRNFLNYIEKFGIFQKTGVDLPGEIFSQNAEFKKGYEINFATASFGQGIEMTAMQLVRAFCAVANGGKLIRPYLVETQSKTGGNEIISSEAASKLTTMLVSVVENGFGKSARIPGYFIAGKTGTAQVPEGGTYSSEKTIQSFIGFAPAFDPKFLIMVKLDNPAAKTAEYSALPIFKSLAKYLIDYYKIPPDHNE